MIAFTLILILFFISLLMYFILKKIKLLSRTAKIVSLIILLFILLLFFLQMFDTDSKNLGSSFIYSDVHKHILGKIDIPPTIISYDYDKHFIIVKQKPKKYNEEIYDKIKYIYPLGRDTVYYWLIIKDNHTVYGPLDIDEFNAARNKYNVSTDLKLK